MTPNPIPSKAACAAFPIPIVLAFLALLAGGLVVDPAAAEPYLAVRSGMKCSACHVNGSGGGKRTEYGNIYSQTLAPWILKDAPGGRKIFDPRAGEFLSFGGNLRLANSTRMRPGEDDNEFAITEGNLYVQADMVPGFLTFYLDERVAPTGALNREAFVLVRNAAGTLRFKAGKMLLPYGLAIWDDEAATRRATGFNFTTSDLGAEVGVDWGFHEWRLAVSNGTGGAPDDNKGKQVTTTLGVVRPGWRLGASASRNPGPEQVRWVWGAHGGVRAGRFELLGEHAVIRDAVDGSDPPYGNAHVAYVEGNARIRQGISLKAAWDWWDPYRDVDEDERSTWRLGVESFVTQFLQVRAFYRRREAPPQLGPQNEDGLDFELHGFF